MKKIKTIIIFSLIFFSVCQLPLTYQTHNSHKTSLIRISSVWLKITVNLTNELYALNKYNVSLKLKVIEAENPFTLYIKGIKFIIGTTTYEKVFDTPLTFTEVGDEHEVSVTLKPEFYASGLCPGDIKDTHMKIELAYFLEEHIKNEVHTVSGLYTVFTSIPIRIIVPKTYVYVQPKIITKYEPCYIINFTVRVWVVGEGYVRNVKVVVRGAPVQCYLLTTGKISAGESRILWTIMNVTELGILTKEYYGVNIEVLAETPWGYIYDYSYRATLHLLKVRELQVKIPNKVIANAYTPVRLSLNPQPSPRERLYFEVYSDGKLLSSGVYNRLIYMVVPPGIHRIKVKVYSSTQAPAIYETTVESIGVKNAILRAYLTDNILHIIIVPLYKDSYVIVEVYSDEQLINRYTIPTSYFAKSGTLINDIPTTQGTYSLVLSKLKGKCRICVRYANQYTTLTYTAQESMFEKFLEMLKVIPLPYPLNIVILILLIAVIIIVILLVILRAKTKKSEKKVKTK